MLTNIQVIGIVVASVIGAIGTGLLGFLESDEPFNIRKFASNIIRGGIGGAFSAFGFSTVETVNPWTYLAAFLIGAGFDVYGKRGAGVILGKKEEKPSG